ncbi:hypothetical protein DENSPDRAFT_867256 [Dentipellis sp. KUC8613]|nr:hypothetical protein DENSPDRAFT_867256 [Dentipellis sp. KUC8613]
MPAIATGGIDDASGVQESFKQRLRALENQLVTLRSTNRTLEQRAFDALQRGQQLAHALGFDHIEQAERVVADDPTTWNRATVDYWKVRVRNLEKEVKGLKEEAEKEKRAGKVRADELESAKEENDRLRKELERLRASTHTSTSSDPAGPSTTSTSTSTIQTQLTDLQSRYDALVSTHKAATSKYTTDLRKWRRFKKWIFEKHQDDKVCSMLRAIDGEKSTTKKPPSSSKEVATPAPAAASKKAKELATPMPPPAPFAALPTPSTAPRTPRKTRPPPALASSSPVRENRTPLGKNIVNETRSASVTPSKRKGERLRSVSMSPSKRQRAQEGDGHARSVSASPSKRRRIREEIDQEDQQSASVSPSKRKRGQETRSPFTSPSKRARNGSSSLPGTPSKRAPKEHESAVANEEEESQTQDDPQALAFWSGLAPAQPLRVPAHAPVPAPDKRIDGGVVDIDVDVKTEVKDEPLELGVPSPRSVKQARAKAKSVYKVTAKMNGNGKGKGKGKGKSRASDPGPGSSARAAAAAGDVTTINAHFEINPALNAGLPFQFDAVERRRACRARLEAGECECCRDYYAAVGPLPPRLQAPRWRSPSPSEDHMHTAVNGDGGAGVREHRNAVSRHRAQWARGRTPPGYWDIGFPTTQEAAGINERAREMQRGMFEEVEREARKEGGRYRRRGA